jgi:hypothetical protein
MHAEYNADDAHAKCTSRWLAGGCVQFGAEGVEIAPPEDFTIQSKGMQAPPEHPEEDKEKGEGAAKQSEHEEPRAAPREDRRVGGKEEPLDAQTMWRSTEHEPHLYHGKCQRA